jgi:hypothetical protein
MVDLKGEGTDEVLGRVRAHAAIAAAPINFSLQLFA